MARKLEILLARLSDPSAREPSTVELRTLSDLPPQQVEKVWRVWQQIPLPRRRRITRLMVELAEANVELNYDKIFRACLHDENEDIRALGVAGLWECEDEDLVGPLVRLLREDGSPRVREAAAQALGQFLLLSELGEINAAVGMMVEEALLGVIHTADEHVDVRRRAVESIAYSSEAGVTDIIEDAYLHGGHKMRVSAIFAMGRNADARWRRLVERVLTHPDPEMRFEAARACGELEHSGALPLLFDLVEDEDAEVRGAAVWAIGQIGGREAERVLLGLLQDPDDPLRHMALLALEMLQFQRQADVPLFEDEDEDWGVDFPDDDLWDL